MDCPKSSLQYTAPEEYRGRGVDFEEEMAAFADGQAYGGYDAFCELFRQFVVTVPIAWLMSLSPVRQVGERVYANVAENRDRYFVCSVDQGN